MKEVFQNLDWSVLTNALLNAIPALLCITVHECCHGLAALWLGDDTAKRAGRLSLNPLRHLDPFGLLMICLFRFGWAKPVPVDMRRFKNRRLGMALTALAGPVSNLLLAALLFLLYGALYLPLYRSSVGGFVLELLYITAIISTNLAVFNFIPIPPLDGSKVLFALLPDRAYTVLMRVERYGMFLLMALLLTHVLDTPLNAVTGWSVSQLSRLAEVTFQLTARFVYA